MDEEAQAPSTPEVVAAPQQVPEEESETAQTVTVGVVLVNYMKKKNLGLVINGQSMTLNHGRQVTFQVTPGANSIGIGFYDKRDLRRRERLQKRELKNKRVIAARQAHSRKHHDPIH